jgi:hypothetical protein
MSGVFDLVHNLLMDSILWAKKVLILEKKVRYGNEPNADG